MYPPTNSTDKLLDVKKIQLPGEQKETKQGGAKFYSVSNFSTATGIGMMFNVLKFIIL